jgi:integrating conjugative element protein (TIGR03759 family)
MNKHVSSALIGIIFTFSSLTLTADEVKESQTALSQSTINATQEKLAKLWDLSIAQYQEYELIMEGPRGNWTPNLDPITVLGINAKSVAERERFAEKLAKLERARVTRELAFEMAYQKAQQKLFGHIPLYETPETLVGLGEASKAKAVDVFIHSDCKTCKIVARKLLKSGVTVNFYFVDFTAPAIKQWAVDLGITAKMISAKQTTLNFDAGRSKALNIQQYPFVKDSHR